MNTSEKFLKLQNDLSVDDARVHWMGEYVRLLGARGQVLAHMTVGTDVAGKIQRWCVKNSYRCSALRDGRVWL